MGALPQLTDLRSSPILDKIIGHGALIAIDKPLHWTSFDVVHKIRNLLKKALGQRLKVGHAGTLDPLATGLLLIGIGKMTKRLHQLQQLSKTYVGTMVLGATTPTYDAEMPPDAVYPIDHIDEQLLQQLAKAFVGEISQIPPPYSAIKVKGKSAYAYARKGEKISLSPRKVVIYDFTLTRIDLPEVDFIVHCGKGVYIRSLVYDFGKECGSGAYLRRLVRTTIGPYKLQQAVSMDEAIALLSKRQQTSDQE